MPRGVGGRGKRGAVAEQTGDVVSSSRHDAEQRRPDRPTRLPTDGQTDRTKNDRPRYRLTDRPFDR